MNRSVSKLSLRSAGLKVTKARQVLLRELEASDRPLTVDEIVERLASPRPGRPTIYRNLELFIREGWAESFVGENKTQRFFYCGTSTYHHHIYCERCQRITELDGCVLKLALAQIERKYGCKVTRHQVLIYGHCPECRNESAQAKKVVRSEVG